MKYKNLAKNLGKTVASVLIPPIGLAMWPREAKNRLNMCLLGMIISISTGIASVWPPKPIYDSPKLAIRNYENPTAYTLPCLFLSPLLLNSAFQREFLLEKSAPEKDSWRVRGENIVEFKDGKYNLNFSNATEFYIDSGRTSLSEVYSRVTACRAGIIKATNHGDIKKAERFIGDLAIAVARKAVVEEQYEAMRKDFGAVVDKMNSKLKDLEALAR